MICVPKQRAYYDSMAAAAAALNIDINELRELKASGRCPEAFRSGRVYVGPLREYIAANQRKKIAALASKKQKTNQEAVVTAIVGILECANHGILTDDQQFEMGTQIVEAVKDARLLRLWIHTQFEWLASTFPELSDAHKTHPKIVDWLCRQGGVRYKTPD